MNRPVHSTDIFGTLRFGTGRSPCTSLEVREHPAKIANTKMASRTFAPFATCSSDQKGCELELELIQPHMAQKPVLRGEVGCACVAREVSVERGGMHT